jgi:hypothetical protein
MIPFLYFVFRVSEMNSMLHHFKFRTGQIELGHNSLRHDNPADRRLPGIRDGIRVSQFSGVGGVHAG